MKNNILFILVFLSGAVFGGFVAGGYVKMHTSKPAVCNARIEGTDLLLAQLEQAGSPEDVKVLEDSPIAQPHSSSEIPSQLVRAELPKDIVLGVKAEQTPTERPVGIVLDDQQSAVVLRAQKPAHRAADGSNKTLIEAPVDVKRIQTLDDYKQFKRVARGSYPIADFSKEEVWVLESQSNLPDKAFEIVEIIPTDTEIKLLYRVNLLGLDQKTNTHSAQKMTKTKLPIVLEQVL